MEEVQAGATNQATVIIIDQNKLRRASVVNFLRTWAESIGASLIGTCLALLPQDLETEGGCRLVVLNLGGSSVDTPDVRCLLRTLEVTLPQIPVVLFSDLDDPEEVVAAFRAGVKGFIPANVEPDIVLQALTFIMGGGSFLPPSVLLKLRIEPDPASAGTSAEDDAHLNDLNSADIDLHGVRSGQLTSRQLDVLSLLRLGKSNKMIARDLGMREATVKVHVRQILRKLGAQNRTQAALSIQENSPDSLTPQEDIKGMVPSAMESAQVEAEKASLLTKGICIGHQLLVSGFAASVYLVQGDALEIVASAPAYIHYFS